MRKYGVVDGQPADSAKQGDHARTEGERKSLWHEKVGEVAEPKPRPRSVDPNADTQQLPTITHD